MKSSSNTKELGGEEGLGTEVRAEKATLNLGVSLNHATYETAAIHLHVSVGRLCKSVYCAEIWLHSLSIPQL